VQGVDTQFRLAVSTRDPEATIKNVAAGQTVEVLVQAVNGDAQGVASAIVQVETTSTEAALPASTAPVAPVAPAAEVTTQPAEKAELPFEPNGSGNGHESRLVSA
jgi:hypothetical protein